MEEFNLNDWIDWSDRWVTIFDRITPEDIKNLTCEQVMDMLDGILLNWTNQRLQLFTQLYNWEYMFWSKNNL